MTKKHILILFLLFTLVKCFSLDLTYAQENFTIEHEGDVGLDINGNGFYEYLQIQVKVAVPFEGLYVVETSGIRDPEGSLMPLEYYQRVALEEGENSLTINFDGRRIRASGMSPKSLDLVSLVTIDSSDARYLNDLKLNGTYLSTDFEKPPEYKVGVSEGNWVVYDVDVLDYPDQVNSQIVWEKLRWEVNKVEDTVVYLNMDFHYSDGSIEEDNMDGYLEKESYVFPFIIPAELQIGDEFGELDTVSIESSMPIAVLGQNRTAYSHLENRVINRTSVDFIFDHEYHWDQETGVMLEAWFNTTRIIKTTNQTLESNIMMSLNSSNIIKEKTSLIIKSVKEESHVSIYVSLTNSKGAPLPDQSISLITEAGKSRTLTTNSTGKIKVDFEDPEKKISAEYNGSDTYLPSMATTEVIYDNGKTYHWVIALGMVSILIAILIAILRSRSIIT
jgi:hypothetical protein